jgi:deazaflavin-dependent oxidoreductase (nitroreductase family)
MMRPLARFLPTFAVVKHRGRRSGQEYETVVNAFRNGNVLAIALAHGKTNWVKNVLAAGEADVHLFRRDVHIINPRVLPAGSDDPALPRFMRRGAKTMGVFVADIA